MSLQGSQPLGLSILGVLDAGVPNLERVVLRARSRISLAGFGLTVGIANPQGGAYPLHDSVFWFPDIIVEPPAWVIVYTGAGKTQQSQMPGGDPALTFHWHRPTVVFVDPSLVAAVFWAEDVEIGKQWTPKPTQLPTAR